MVARLVRSLRHSARMTAFIGSTPRGSSWLVRSKKASSRSASSARSSKTTMPAAATVRPTVSGSARRPRTTTVSGPFDDGVEPVPGERIDERGRHRRAHLHAAGTAGGQLADRRRGDVTATIDDHDVVDRVGDLGEEVAGHEHGPPLASEVDDEAPQPADPVGVEAVRRLVEHEDARIAEQRGRQAEALAHAQGEPADASPGDVGEADEIECLVDAVRRDRGRPRRRSPGGHGLAVRGGSWTRRARRRRVCGGTARSA